MHLFSFTNGIVRYDYLIVVIDRLKEITKALYWDNHIDEI